jgi:predicted amidohydrolase
MKISVIQPDTVWEDKTHNFQSLTKLLSPLYNNTDIIILPEMFNTGFSMKPAELSESPDGETYRWMKDIARKGNFGVCGSYIVKEDANFFNRWVFVSPDNDTWHYDKRHLFSMGGEDRLFSHGKSRLIFSFRGTRIMPLICYDLRFPVWSRNNDEYDLLIFAANWPAVRQNVWTTLLRARAIENQCFVAGSNRTGTDGEGIVYSGESMIINSRGGLIACADTDKECSISAEISMTELSDFRKRFPVMNDADTFTIDL